MAAYLRQRQGCYYLRLRIPAELSSTFPEKEILKSLNTKDRRVARLSSSRLAAGILEVFTLTRHGFISAEQAREKTSKLLQREAPRKKPVKEPVISTPNPSPSLKSMIDQYTTDNQSGWAPKTLLEYQSHFRLLLDIIGNVSINTIDRDTVRNLRDTLSMLPANMYKRYPNTTVEEVLARKDTPMSATTINKLLSLLGSIMRHCVKEGHVSSNPVEGLKIQQKKKADEERKAYDRGDLKKITRALPDPSDRPERYWVPLIGMFSGMRLDEICSLYTDDVKEFEGVPCFDVNAKRDKKLKTVTSERVLPIHPELIRLGFLDYVEKVKKAGVPRLWMSLKWREADGYSNALGKWFQKFNRRYITTDPLKTFHSLRHAFADTLKQQGEQEAIIAELMGHANGSITTGRYGKKYRPQVLLEAIHRLDYDTGG